ncbi:hypothetical protein W1240910_154 [Cyanophage S-RIM12_W1_24_0910]|uniref:OMP1 protein n=2 Tax=Brizovirus TaxID=2733098 RepID=A0A1D7SXI2_9CAUD|nr:hypothetical protein HOQ64_gp080 [Cyanophage S-RIM12 isolate RW_01_0310]AOO15854.1 hypothetical protein RW010310_153 [Cyanophage S-RIM12 isolate RW_01_0310]AOO18217.1 hypothetical protein Sn070910_152 [Cyanophage S-RIM12_Sn_07_0910]AOO18431.1 hypothetical protein Sn310910_154 [Cyanophage S-RIM12_Sn_31_0910]AOO19074.1 hypothetical protein W1240910_154 [Cyanophage S-RIM12_W1_24_0910]
MKRFLPFIMLLMTAPAANAGALTHKLSSSVQLTVDAAASNVTRLGSTFSISGNNIGTTDGTTADAVSAGTITSGIYSPGTIEAVQGTAESAFSFSQSYTQGDAIPAAAVTVGDVANFGNITSTTAGTAGTLAGTIGTTGAISLTAGGAGTNATGQFVSELSIIH